MEPKTRNSALSRKNKKFCNHQRVETNLTVREILKTQGKRHPEISSGVKVANSFKMCDFLKIESKFQWNQNQKVLTVISGNQFSNGVTSCQTKLKNKALVERCFFCTIK